MYVGTDQCLGPRDFVWRSVIHPGVRLSSDLCLLLLHSDSYRRGRHLGWVDSSVGFA